MLREFKDRNGTDWLVWDVYPTAEGERMADPGSVFPHREFAEGWLCFESKTEKRRVTPVPIGWHDWSDDQLNDLCAGAGYVSQSGQRSRASREVPKLRDSDSEARR
jgi:hypothetical protein